MRILCFLLLICHLNVLAQTEGIQKESEPKLRIGERGLNRFFFDSSLGFGWSTGTSGVLTGSYHEYGGLTDFRIGNNFYFGQGLKPMILRLTYFRTGLYFSDGLGLYLVPPSIGLGKHFNMRKNDQVSLEPMVHFGAITTMELLSEDLEYYKYYVSFELKLNIALFSLGAEFTTGKVFQSSYLSSKNFERNTYIGISLGRRFGKNLRFSD